MNKYGKFNVPIGTKECVILDTGDFNNVSTLLKCAVLKACDFEDIIDTAEANDFIFVDPPYTAKHNKNGFIKYNETLFSWHDQERLKQAVERASKRGVKVLITNAGHSSIEKLYCDLGQCSRISRHSILSGDASKRVPVEEFVIRTWV